MLRGCSETTRTSATSTPTSATARRCSRSGRSTGPSSIIHCAAQPSHDLAATRPLDDFDVNAVGTINLLEATRRHAPEAVFICMSTNKVYGDAPNYLPLVETRDPLGLRRSGRLQRHQGDDVASTSACTASSARARSAADVMAQEYGRYFGLRTGIFRGGCLTGPSHSGVELHGFLNYLVKVAQRRRDLHDLRLQGEAGARPDPQLRRDPGARGRSRRTRGRARSTTSAAAATTAA